MAPDQALAEAPVIPAGAFDDDLDALSGKKNRKIIFLAALCVADLLLAAWAATIGPADLTVAQACRAFWEYLFPGSFQVPELHNVVVMNIRLPRIIMANIVGLGLGMAGCAMQGVLKNPLASPYTLGISAAAGFGAALAIVLGVGVFSSQYLIVGNAFIFALGCSLVVLGLSGSRNASPESMILAGIAIMFLFSAGITVLQYIADPYAVQSVVFWLVGDVGRASWEKIALGSGVLGLAAPYLMFKAWDLDIIGFGDETAISLGINADWTRRLVMIVCSIMTASLVAFVGTIGFIGLVAPHIARLAFKANHSFLLPASGLIGALLLSAADMIALTVLAPEVLPIGVVTAFMGVPIFLFFIIRRKEIR